MVDVELAARYKAMIAAHPLMYEVIPEGQPLWSHTGHISRLRDFLSQPFRTPGGCGGYSYDDGRTEGRLSLNTRDRCHGEFLSPGRSLYQQRAGSHGLAPTVCVGFASISGYLGMSPIGV